MVSDINLICYFCKDLKLKKLTTSNKNSNRDKTKQELQQELDLLRSDYDHLKAIYSNDIAQLKTIKEALRESESKYRLLATNSSDVIWTLDNDYRFTYISPSIFRLRGFTPEEAMKETIEETMTEESRETVYKAIIEGKANEQRRDYRPVQVEIEQYHKNGSTVWVGISLIAMVDDNDEKCGYIGISRNITQRIISEKKLRESEDKLRELNSQKDKFFSIIAHDLKSPFNAILGFSELLYEQIEDKDYNQIDKYVKIISESSRQVVDLLTNLLEWSRAHTGRILFNPEPINLIDIIDDNISLFEALAAQKSIVITKNINIPSESFADKSIISTVIRNLISNAIKFTNKGGEISIYAEKQGDKTIISVLDNGVGISQSRLDKLFCLDNCDSTYGTNKEHGTGLGLILCKELIEKHGGKIWAESQERQYSRFYILF